MRPLTKVLGYGIIGTVVLASGCVSALAAALLAFHADERASAGQPPQEMIVTVERLKGTASFAEGSSYIDEVRDPSGRVHDTMAPFEAVRGDRIKWRFRRSRWLGFFMPLDVVKCPPGQPC